MNEHSSRSHAIFILTVECSAVSGSGLCTHGSKYCFHCFSEGQMEKTTLGLESWTWWIWQEASGNPKQEPQYVRFFFQAAGHTAKQSMIWSAIWQTLVACTVPFHPLSFAYSMVDCKNYFVQVWKNIVWPKEHFRKWLGLAVWQFSQKWPRATLTLVCCCCCCSLFCGWTINFAFIIRVCIFKKPRRSIYHWWLWATSYQHWYVCAHLPHSCVRAGTCIAVSVLIYAGCCCCRLTQQSRTSRIVTPSSLVSYRTLWGGMPRQSWLQM